MKKTNIIYWVFTALLSLFIVPGAIFNVLSSSESVELFRHLGYPTYIISFLGAAKLLGIVAILLPGYSRIKEWAYAGLCYDLLGAIYSGLASGDGTKSLLILIGLTIVVGSYVYHHKRLKEVSPGKG